MRPDLLITWIKHCDYPLFRKYLRDYRHKLNKVIILFSEHNRFPYFDHFIHEALKDLDITFIDSAKLDWGTQDWRNIATNKMLEYSDSEWVCSIEQDFFADDWEKLWGTVDDLFRTSEHFGWKAMQGSQPHQEYLTLEYVHPSFWFIKRDLLEKTDKNFSADQGLGADHFGLVVRDVIKLGVTPVYLQDIGYVEWEKAFHLGGVNQNYLEGMKEGFTFHRPEMFSSYNYWSQKIETQDPRHLELCKQIATKLPEPDQKWEQFFS